MWVHYHVARSLPPCHGEFNLSCRVDQTLPRLLKFVMIKAFACSMVYSPINVGLFCDWRLEVVVIFSVSFHNKTCEPEDGWSWVWLDSNKVNKSSLCTHFIKSLPRGKRSNIDSDWEADTAAQSIRSSRGCSEMASNGGMSDTASFVSVTSHMFTNSSFVWYHHLYS